MSFACVNMTGFRWTSKSRTVGIDRELLSGREIPAEGQEPVNPFANPSGEVFLVSQYAALPTPAML
jgi:hypothetical protein